MMDLSWVWHGFLILCFLGLMWLVMWATDEGLKYAQKVWDKVFNSLSKPF